MANIVFLLDFEEGHVFPTLGLASALKVHGHQVSYWGIPDTEHLVRGNGFEFYPVMADIYPLGYVKKNITDTKEKGDDAITKGMNVHILPMIQHDIFGQIIRQNRPDLIISSTFISLEALILYIKTRIPQVIFAPFFMNYTPLDQAMNRFMYLGSESLDVIQYAALQGFKINDFKDLTLPLKQFPVIIPCPLEFDILNATRPSNFNYIEPSIRTPVLSDQFDWSSIPTGKKIIFASLGSQNQVYELEKVRSFYSKMVEIMRTMLAESWHLVLSLGNSIKPQELVPIPSSITALPWVPQVEILRHASVMITHGGLGTIKESIFYGVPMIVFPFDRDQPANAERVKCHNLGVPMDIESSSVEDILHTIDKVMNDSSIRSSIQHMQEVFHRYESSHPGVDLIEKTLKSCASGEQGPF